MGLSMNRFIFSLLEAGLLTLIIYFILPKQSRLSLKATGLFYTCLVLVTFFFLRNHLLSFLIYQLIIVMAMLILGQMPVYVASITLLISYIIGLMGSLIATIFAVYFFNQKLDFRFVLEEPIYLAFVLKLFIVGSCLYIYKIFNALFRRKTKIQKINPRPVVVVNFFYIVAIIFLSCELIQYIPTVYTEVLKIESLNQLLFTGIFTAYIGSIFVLYIVNVYLFKSSDYLSIKLSSEIDALTGVLNRKAGIAFLKEGMQQVQNKKGKLSICYVDVNNLKTVNDNYGHKIGDDLICQTTRIISSALREGDEIARLGGDEFLIVFNQCALDQAMNVWLRILEKFETFNLTQNKVYDISVSVGFSEYHDKMTCTTEELIEEADQKMYEEKTRYKNTKGHLNGKW